ncbi:prepilin peptidase [Bacillus sp. FJAT-27445]|uniref:A24 family peptidase n=1 Tax=Bacillus sp. FJAT-27445 TaxID=1679166 RepID=UPI0007444DB8|nr:prepilin peptidase [Bacillus sp. FJAT-27445]
MINAILLFLLLVICTVTDVRERKIYNKVLLPFLIVSLAVNLMTGGLEGFTLSILGFLAGFGILLIPYLLGGMGAGDVKLLAVIGALMGAKFVALSAIYMALAGGVFALFLIVFRKSAKQLIKGLFFSFLGLMNGLKIPIIFDKDSMKQTYPYGVAIAVGAAIQFFRAGMIL